MTGAVVLAELGRVIAAAGLALLIGRLIRLPPVLMWVIAGLLLGPATGVLHASGSLHLLGELGIALLLFLVGLELSPATLRDIGRPAAVVGGLQVAVTGLLGTGAAILLGLPLSESLLVAAAITFSSTVVVVKLLEREGALGGEHGRLSVGVLLVQDVVVAVVLTLLAGLGGSGVDAGAVAEGLGRAFAGLALLTVTALLAGRWILPGVAEWMAESTEGLLVGSLAWCLAFIVGAELLGLSVELGAFLAGLALAPTRVHAELRRRIRPLADLFLAVFFVVLGAELLPGAAFERPLLLITVVIMASVIKPLAIIVLARGPGGRSWKTAVLTGLTLGQMSEFSFILASAAAAAGLVGPEFLALVGVAGVTTIAGSAVVIPLLERGWDRFGAPRLGEATDAEGPTVPGGHVVVVGMNTLGRHLVEAFPECGERVVAVDSDPGKLAGLPVVTVQGLIDHRDVLMEAGVPDARLVVSALRIEDANRLLAWRCRRLGVPTSIHVFDGSVRADLERLGVDHLMDSKRAATRSLRAALVELEVLD